MTLNLALRLGAITPSSAWTPATVSPYAWYDASDSSTISHTANAVTQWRDKSGNARHLGLGIAPTTNVTTQNGLNVIDFDGGDVMLASTAADWKFLHDGTNHLIGVVCRVNVNGVAGGATDAGFIMATASSAYTAQGFWLWVDSRGGNAGRAKHNSSSTASWDNISANNAFGQGAARTLTVLGDPDNATAADRSAQFVDGGSAIKNNSQTATPSSSNPGSALAVGGAGASDSFARLLGWVAEIVIVSGAEATESNRALLLNYLKTKWNTP